MRERYDLTATLRRVLAACGKFRLVATLTVMGSLLSSVAVYARSIGVGLVAGLTLILTYVLILLPQEAYTEPDPVFERGKIESEGMSERDFALRMGIIKERDEYKKELQEEKEREAKREAKRNRQGGHRFG